MKYLKVFKNWRIVFLTIIAAAALLLILGDGNRFSVIVFAKVVGGALAYVCYGLGKHWNEKGEIDEIKVFNDNE